MARPLEKIRGVYENPVGSGIWWIRYADQFKQIHREKVGLRSAAKEIYRQRKTEIRLGKFDPADIRRKHQNVNVAEIIEDYIKACEANKRKSLRDIKQRVNWWKSRLGERAAKSIVKEDIESARLDLSRQRTLGYRQKNSKESPKSPRAVATVNRYLATFKSVFLMALANEKVNKNPFLKVKLQKENNTRVRFLAEEEEQKLFKVIPKRWHAPILVALNTGMRFGEQMRLEWKDVDFEQRVITVRESKSGKTRYIPLNQVAIDAMKSIPVRMNCPWVFYNEDGDMRGQLPRQWEGWIKEAGIENFHWHDLRHTFASRLVMAGVDLYAVKELLGHNSIEMTQRYAHLDPSYLKQAIEALVLKKQLAPELAPVNKSA